MLQDEDLTFLWPQEPQIDSLWEVAAREYNQILWCCGQKDPYNRWCIRKKEHSGPHVAGPDDPMDYVIWEVIRVPHDRLGYSYETRILDERT